MSTHLGPDVELLGDASRPSLWHRRTGRSAAISAVALDDLGASDPSLPPPPHLAALVRRLADLHMLADAPPLCLDKLIPARSRLVLTLPAQPALWLPVPAARTAGGHGWTARPLTGAELAIWRAINGSRSVAQVANSAHIPLAAVLAFLATLTTPEVQAAQLRDRPVRGREPSLARLVAPRRPTAARSAHHHGAEGQTTLERYHLDDITDGATHFDDRETTVAHAFALPHPGLAGRRYGEALHAALEARGMLPPDDGSVLEIGPGTGELGAAFLARAAQRGLPRGEMIRLDQSPALLRTQRCHQPGTRELLGSATDLPLPQASVSLVLCNEVIADLEAVPFDADRDRAATSGPRADLVRKRLRRYDIAPLPTDPQTGAAPLYNLGAWLLIEQLYRVIRPGGAAFISEFGSLDETPTPTRFLDHPEVSIHFGQLVQVARRLGFQARCLPLPELLDLELSTRWLSRHSYEGLRARMRSEGRHLPARAWTIDTLDLPWPVEGLEEVSLSEEGPAPVPTRFMALLLWR